MNLFARERSNSCCSVHSIIYLGLPPVTTLVMLTYNVKVWVPATLASTCTIDPTPALTTPLQSSLYHSSPHYTTPVLTTPLQSSLHHSSPHYTTPVLTISLQSSLYHSSPHYTTPVLTIPLQSSGSMGCCPEEILEAWGCCPEEILEA